MRSPGRAGTGRAPVAVVAVLLVLILGPLVVVGAPAWARQPAVEITGVQSSPGRVEFFLAARDLPGGLRPTGANVTVHAGDTALTSTVRTVAGAGAGAGAGRQAPRRAVVLVLDASRSMAGARLRAARAAALGYAASAPADVWLGLVAVSDTPLPLLAPTADRAAFAAAVDRIRADGKTALYDSILAAERLLDQADEFVERRVVILSDGGDTASTVDDDQLGRQLARADAIVDAVTFGAADRTRLGELVSITGGRTIPAANADALNGIFRDMAAQLGTPVVVTAVVPPRLAGRPATLRVTVTGPAGPATGGAPVTFAIDPAAAVTPRTVSVAGTGPAALIVALLALAGALFLAALLALLPLVRRTETQRRLDQLDRFSLGHRAGSASSGAGSSGAGSSGAGSSGAGSSGVASSGLRAALAVSERAVRRPGGYVAPRDRPWKQRVGDPLVRRLGGLGRALTPSAAIARLQRHLDYAGNPPAWPIERVIPVKGVALAVGALAGGLLGLLFNGATGGLVGTSTGALAGLFGPDLMVYNAGLKRQQELLRSLPDVLDTLVISVEAGLGFDAALAQVGHNGKGPLARETVRVLQEMQIGRSRAQALRSLADRTTVPELRTFVSAVVQAGELGVPIAGVLREHSREMRIRRRQRAEELAQKVPIKILFPVLFCLFPALFVVILGPGVLQIMHAFSR